MNQSMPMKFVSFWKECQQSLTRKETGLSYGTDTTKGFFVKTEEFQDMWVPFFGPDKNNIEFENLQDELDISPDESGDLKAYNAKAGTKIIVSGVKNGEFINAHFGNTTKVE